MTYTKIIPICTAAFAVTAMTFAGTPAIRAQTQAEMNQRATQDAAKADAAMNIAYKKLMTMLNPAQKAQLAKAQRAWLVFRDAEADFRSSGFLGGTAHPMVYEGHIRVITEERTRELRDNYHSLATGGDM